MRDGTRVRNGAEQREGNEGLRVHAEEQFETAFNNSRFIYLHVIYVLKPCVSLSLF